MGFKTAFPFFPSADIKNILREFRGILEGKGMLTMGSHVSKFESDFSGYTGARYAVATNSCTSALEIALAALGIGRGDEVIVPVQTFIATGSCVLTTQASIKFCNVDRNFLLDLADLKKKITPRTKAVILVHFAGLIHPQVFILKKFLRQKGIYLIEDAAHACGAAIGGRFAGTLGDIGCFSFFATKIITTGEGGMITTNDKKLFLLCSSLRNRGLDLSAPQERYSRPGRNSRMSEVQGIMGYYQLKRLEAFLRHRNAIAQVYKSSLRPLEKKGVIALQEYPESVRHAYWRFVIFLNDTVISRKALKTELQKKGIAIDWPYQPLLHLQPLFKSRHVAKDASFAVSERLASSHFCIPIHVGISTADAKHIAGLLLECLSLE